MSTPDTRHGRLPILGITWTGFATLAEATAFAAWAERSIRHDRHPCEAFIERRHDMPSEGRYEVKVRNW
jgi:hypothetical protein